MRFRSAPVCGALSFVRVHCGNLMPIRRGHVGDPREELQNTDRRVEPRLSRMSRSSTNFAGSSAKILLPPPA
jgi:hypothetical protein